MKARIFVLLLAAIFGAALPASAAGAFFRNMTDVPLMPGLQERPADAVVFDQPQGRIAEAVALSGTISTGAIRDFYHASLPQLGWQPTGPDIFSRGSERLTLQFKNSAAGPLLHVSIMPRP